MNSSAQPIPLLRGAANGQTTPIEECGEPLVPLSMFAPDRIAVDARYYAAGLPAALPEGYARETVARRLAEAAGLLPARWRFVVFDAWRPLAVQQQIYEGYWDTLRREHPAASERTIHEWARRYVARPSADPVRPSPHATGGVVDLSLLDAAGAPVDMGTPFDTFDAPAHTRYYERRLERGDSLTGREAACLRHRRLLFHALMAAGFTNYQEEWWHFEYGRSQYGLLFGLQDWRVVAPGRAPRSRPRSARRAAGCGSTYQGSG